MLQIRLAQMNSMFEEMMNKFIEGVDRKSTPLSICTSSQFLSKQDGLLVQHEKEHKNMENLLISFSDYVNKHFAFLVKGYNFSMTEHKTVMYTTWVRFTSEEYEVTIGREIDVLFARIESISDRARQQKNMTTASRMR